MQGAGAIVPFNTLGPSADQGAEERLIQFGQGIVLRLKQEPRRANAVRAGGAARGGTPALLADGPGGEGDDDDGVGGGVQWPHDQPQGGAGTAAGGAAAGANAAGGGAAGSSPLPPGAAPGQDASLGHVGLVVWQSGYVLADFLLRRPPLGPWSPGHCVIDLGAGTGVVGLALCCAGARVALTDLPHITPLTAANVAANAPHPASSGHTLAPKVVDYAWGDPVGPLLAQAGGYPDVITASDVLYDAAMRPPLLAALRLLSAPHTLTFIAYRKRRAQEEAFVGEAEAAGFAVAHVPSHLLAPEFQDGTYCMLRLAVRDSVEVSMGTPPLVGPAAPTSTAPAAPVFVGGRVRGGLTGTAEEDEDEEGEDIEHRPCAQQ